jgi:hypothetical protein
LSSDFRASAVKKPFGPASVIPPPRDALRFYNGEPVEEIMVYPAAEKVGRITLLTHLMERFKARLRDTGILVIVGYSLRDDAIVESIDEAMTRNRGFMVIVVDPNADELRRRYFCQRDFLNRTLAMPLRAGEALAENRLSATVNKLRSI